MAMTAARGWPAFFAVIAATCAAAPAVAQEPSASFIDHLLRQITCQYRPEPTATLLYLSRNKHIDARKGERVDGETCWKIYPPLEIDGIAFTHVCASSEDPLLIELYPLLYYRGAGTSPGSGLRLVTGEDEAAVDDWLERAKTRIGLAGATKLDIGAPTFVAGKTEISCSSTSFLQGE
jgi:hypothetical protein